MDTQQVITDLQPLFCSRASLLRAQAKLDENPDLDAQLVVRFSDGTLRPLDIKRTVIEDMLYEYKVRVETEIQNALDAADSSTSDSDSETDGE